MSDNRASAPPPHQLLNFPDVSNYRGCLQAKEEGGQFFWRVDCDVSEEGWQPIPRTLYEELRKHHGEANLATQPRKQGQSLREEWSKPGGLMDGPFA